MRHNLDGNITYTNDKRANTEAMTTLMLSRLSAMFKYNTVDDITKNLDKILFIHGDCFFMEHKGTLYVFPCSETGELDAYGEYTSVSISVPFLNLATVVKKSEGVYIKNTTYGNSVLDVINKYIHLLVETDTTIKCNLILSRMQSFITASDKSTLESARLYTQKLIDGEISVIGDNALLDSIKLHSAPVGSNNNLTQLIELEQYLKGSMLNELGINANYNMKREAIGSNESGLNDDFLIPLVTDMLNNRINGLNEVNAKYGTTYTVEFNTIWKDLTKETPEEKTPEEQTPDGVTEEHGNDENITD